MEALELPGALMPRSTMFWRNQAGPMELWRRDGVDTGPYFGFYAKSGTEPVYTNMFLMCLPQNLSTRYLSHPDFAGVLTRLGLECSAAPNSVCIRSASASKDLPVRWLSTRPEYELSLDNVIAFGDNPLGNDRSLASLPVPFVSVAPEDPGTPEGCEDGGFYHVGGCEAGTAAVVQLSLELLRGQEAGSTPEAAAALLRQHLPALCTSAVSKLARGDSPLQVEAAPAEASAL